MSGTASLGCWRRLAWDSEQFGIEIARLEPPRMSFGDLKSSLKACERVGVELAYWTVDPQDDTSNAAALAWGGRLVDQRCVYERLLSVDDRMHGVGQVAEARMLSARSRELLAQLALQSGERSRFKIDANMPGGAWEGLYRTWMTRSLAHEIADAVLIETEGDDPIGVITLARRESSGVIGLFSVDAAQRGRGVGTVLLSRALDWFQRAGCDRVEVATQGENVGARRVYERAGFRLATQANVFHFWMNR